MILISKGYVKHNGKRIKFLFAQVFHDPYGSDNFNEWVIRLPDTAKRYLHHTKGYQYASKWFAKLPVGIWCRIAEPEVVEDAA